jgi:hypothetical protein
MSENSETHWKVDQIRPPWCLVVMSKFYAQILQMGTLFPCFFFFVCLGFFTFNVEKEECCFIENLGEVDENVLSTAFIDIQNFVSFKC